MTALVLALLLAPAPAAEGPLRVLIQQYAEARNNQDRAAVERLFTADADQLVSSGEWRRGRPALVEGAMASSRRETGRRTLTVETVRFLAPEIALVDARYEIGERQMWSAFVCIRQAGAWRIAAIRNMLPAAPSR
jgi:uncharacterized protein (TIGR02246 family)